MIVSGVVDRVLRHGLLVSIDNSPLKAFVKQEDCADTPIADLSSVYAKYVGDERQIFCPGHELIQIRIVGDIGQLLLAQKRLLLHRDPVDQNLALLDRIETQQEGE